MKHSNVSQIYLVNARNDAGTSSISNDYSFPALGVVALGTWLNNKIPYANVTVRDGGAVPTKDIITEIEKYKPGIVGVSVLSTSYQTSLQIAQAAKDIGATVVFGNDQAAQLGQSILRNRPEVDFVVGSEYGEKSLELLVRNLNGENTGLENIPQLTYRLSGEVVGFSYTRDKSKLSILENPTYGNLARSSALDIFPIPDRSLLPKSHWEAYLANYLSKFESIHKGTTVTGVTTMNRARGCSRSKEIAQCKFCDMYLDPVFSSPSLFWDDVKKANLQTNANIFYEVCDSLSSFPRFIDEIVDAKPSIAELGFDPKFFVYAQASDIVRNPKILEKFKKMGVFRVNIGLESGCDVTLKHMKGSQDSVMKNNQAIELLSDQGMFLYGSLVLGSDVETPQTLRQTVNWALDVIDKGLIADIEAQPLLPLPNNFYGKKLRSSGILTNQQLNSDWPWNFEEMSQIYINRFSGVSYADVCEAAKEIRLAASQKRINFGSGVSKEKNYF